MSDTKILQALLDGQTSIRTDIKGVKEEVKKNGERIDKLGMQLAELSVDALTVEDFDKVEKRVTKLEKINTSN